MKAALVKVTKETENIRSFWFKPTSHLNHTAGQYLELTLPHPNADDRGQKRWFTISSSPSEELISITTKFSNPSSSFKTTLKNLALGSKVQILGPMGDFVLPKDRNTPLLFVCGGIGVTPLMSTCKWLVDTSEQRDIQLIYFVSDESEIIFQDVFKKCCKQVNIHISSVDGSISGRQVMELSGYNSPLIFLSGPEPMIESLVKQLTKLGIASHDLVTDYFPGYSAI